MIGRKTLAASLAFAFALLGGAASASTVNISVTGTKIDVTCDGTAAVSCQGLVNGSLIVAGNVVTGGTAASLSTTNANVYDIGNSSIANEAQALDFLIDGVDDNDFIGANASKTDANGADFLSFLSDAEYIVFKIGAGHFFLQLTGPGIVNITFDKDGQQKGGLSHYTEFGQLAAVPIPAAGLLLIAGLAGLGALRRRKAAA
jgi:hypothetical protein